jgi:hypothetical protein
VVIQRNRSNLRLPAQAEVHGQTRGELDAVLREQR